MTVCGSCGSAQAADARFCSSCGRELSVVSACGSCQAEIAPEARFCSSCGAPQGAQPAQQKPAQGSAQGSASRRITSVLFGDLVGFTSLSEVRDQEEVRELLTRYFEECRQIIARYGGTVEKFIGDAVMAVWGVPTAHEDDAERSVRAGLELVDMLTAMGADLGIPDLAMRVGIVTGEVAVTVGAQMQGMVAGDAVNTASRVQSAAAPGQVWVDETTRLLTSAAITYVDVGSHQMKGKADPMPLWAVRAVVASVGGAQRADGLEAPHVGRDRELRLVKELFHGVEETQRPALLVIGGEPGVGKSRLAWEFEKYVDGLSSSVLWHSGRCLSYGEGVAFFALAEAIRSRLQNTRPDAADRVDDDEDQALLLAEGLDRYVPDPDERAWVEPRLAALLGIGGTGTFTREDLFGAWTTFLHRVSEDQHPVVLLIDDAQHADDGLVTFLEHLLAVGTFPCFVVLLTRPELLEKYPRLAVNRRATVVHLNPLAPADMSDLLDGLVVGLPDEARASLVERAEGLPLFAVETVRSLIDRDLVVPRGGQYVLAGSGSLDLDAIGAPASLQALLSARLDTLAPDQRWVLDQASVLGTSFGRGMLERLCQDLANLDEVLADLVRLQLLRQESNRFSGELGQYQFVQSAVRQVAYGTLSRRDRKAGHLAVVGLLEEAGDEASDELAPIIAQHCLDALDAVPDAPDHDDLTGAAVGYLRRAARRASALGARAEAAGHLAVALERATDHGVHAAIGLDLADELLSLGRYDDAVQHGEQAREAFQQLDQVLEAAMAVAVVAMALENGHGEYDRASAMADEQRKLLRGRPDAARVQVRLIGVQITASLRTDGDFLALSNEQVCLAELIGDPFLVAVSYTSLALAYNNRAIGLSRLLLERAAEIAGEAHDVFGESRALGNLAANWSFDDAARAAEIGRRALAAAVASAAHTSITNAVSNLSLATLLGGQWDEAVELTNGDLPTDDIPITEFVRCTLTQARGEVFTPAPELDSWDLEDDVSLASFKIGIDAQLAEQADDPGAAAIALDSARRMFSLAGLYDDFAMIWQSATEIAWSSGEEAVLGQLLAMVDDVTDQAPPRGIRAHRALLAGRLAARAGGDPVEVEQHFRTALAEAGEWHSALETARVCADLGVWLTREGRSQDAEPLLARARAIFTDLGAAAWAAALDDRLAGVSA